MKPMKQFFLCVYNKKKIQSYSMLPVFTVVLNTPEK